MRVIPSAQSDGKSEFLDPRSPRGKFAKRGSRSSFAARRETHAVGAVPEAPRVSGARLHAG
eukprot:6064285-Prymnesium_polylepis.1